MARDASLQLDQLMPKLDILINAAKTNNQPPADIYEINDKMQVSVTSTIRKGPSPEYQEVGTYKAGQEVTVFDLTNRYYRTLKN